MKCICLSFGGYSYHMRRIWCPVHRHLPLFQKIPEHDVPLPRFWPTARDLYLLLLAIGIGLASMLAGVFLYEFFVWITK